MAISIPSSDARVATKSGEPSIEYRAFFQALTNALILLGPATPGSVLVISSGGTVTAGPPSSAITNSDVLAWLGL